MSGQSWSVSFRPVPVFATVPTALVTLDIADLESRIERALQHGIPQRYGTLVADDTRISADMDLIRDAIAKADGNSIEILPHSYVLTVWTIDRIMVGDFIFVDCPYCGQRTKGSDAKVKTWDDSPDPHGSAGAVLMCRCSKGLVHRIDRMPVHGL